MTSALTSAARNAYTRALPFALTLLVGAAALTLALAGARAIADIVGPVFLALVLTISLHPIRIWLEQHRLPEWAASIVLLLAAYLVLGLLTLALIVSVAQLAELLPQYEDQITAVVADAGNTLQSLGVQQEQINAVVDAIDPGQLVALAGAVLASTLGVLSNLFFLIVLLFFMAFDTDSTRRSLAVLGNRMPDLAAALSSFARGARNYMGVAAGFGFIVAILDGMALAVHGRSRGVRVGRAGLRHQLHPQHRLRHRSNPASPHRAARRRPRTDDRRHRHLQRHQLSDPVRHPAPRRRRHCRTDRPVHLHVTGVLDLGHRPTRRAARRTAHPARQGTADRNQPPFSVGTAADRGQSQADRAAEAGATPERSGWNECEMRRAGYFG